MISKIVPNSIQGCEASDLSIEDGVRLKIAQREDDKNKAYKLRHILFSQELKWVPESEDGREIDEYDTSAVMLIAQDSQNQVLGHMRIHPPETPFMIEDEFSQLLHKSCHIKKTPDIVEVTRCGVAPWARSLKFRTPWGSADVFTLLIKGTYAWCLEHGCNYVYAVTDHKVIRLLKMRGFPVEPLGEPTLMPDGVIAVAFGIDWRRFEEKTFQQNRGMLAWFTPDPKALAS